MSAKTETLIWLAQRLSAMVLAPLVLVHIVTVITAIRGGLSAAEILSRTQGSLFWGGLYGLFVLAAAIHGAIGLRTVIGEMTPWRGRSLDAAAVAFAVLLMAMGFRAVGALT